MATEAHALVSAAGMLGFRDLSDAFRALETACLDDTELEPVLDRVRGSLDATLTAIAALKAAA